MRLHNKLKRMLCLAVAPILLVASATPVCAAAFSDITGHWAEKVIEKWSGKGVVEGYQRKFRPDDYIIRGDMALILNRLMQYKETSENTFEDLDSNAYYADAVLKLNCAGIMQGYEGKARPGDFITREEAFVMVDRIYKFKGDATKSGFADEADISDWALPSILAMRENKIVNGSDGNVRPKSNITRAEILQLLENITTYLGEGGDELTLESGTSPKPGNGGLSVGGGGRPSGNKGNTGGSDAEDKDDTSSEDNKDTENAIGGNDLEAGGIW